MEIRVSVRQLVEFILREGDIDNRRTGSSDTAMQEGSRIHRLIQRRMGSDYHAEVSLKCSWNAGDYDILVEGRADGIIDFNWEKHITAKSVIAKEDKETLLVIEEEKVAVVYKRINGGYGLIEIEN